MSAAGLPSPRAAAALVSAGFQRWASYRAATLAGAFTNTFFGVVKLAILFAAAEAAGGAVAGYDRAALSTYTWIAQGMIGVLVLFGGFELAQRVRSGDVAIDLGRPVHPVAGWLAEDVGRAGQACLVRLLVPLAVGALVFGVRVPEHLLTLPLFVLSGAIGMVVSFGCRLLVNLAAFWLLDIRGLATVYMVSSNVLCGLVAPVAFFPDWLRVVAYATPFPHMLQTPVDIAVERVSGVDALVAVGLQLAWAAALLGLGVLVLRRGTRRLVVQGG